MSGLEDRIRAAVATVEDPEVPITLADLGVLRDIRLVDGAVRVVLRPTRLACPARDEMARRVREAVRSAAADVQVDVDWELSAWRGCDVSERGTSVLLQIGYADPTSAGASRCPYCGSTDVRSEGTFGGAVCKVPFSCRACGSTFDELKGAVSATAGSHAACRS